MIERHDPDPESSRPQPNRFEHLCAALKQLKADYAAHREIHRVFALRMVDALRAHLQTPDGCLSYFAVHGVYANRKVMGLIQALHLADDGWWRFGLVLELFEDINQVPYEPVAYIFRLRVMDGMAEVQAEDGEVFRFADREDADFAPMGEWLYRDALGKFENALARFLETGDVKHRRAF